MDIEKNQKTVTEVLEDMGFFVGSPRLGTITTIFRRDAIDATFKTEVLVVKDCVGVVLWYNFFGEKLNVEEIRKKLTKVNSLPSFSENGKRWMRIGISEKEHHIFVAAEIPYDMEGKINYETFKSKLETVLRNTEENWPL